MPRRGTLVRGTERQLSLTSRWLTRLPSRSPPPETPAAPRVRLSHPCSAASGPPASCLTSGPTFVILRPWKWTLPASDPGSIAISYQFAQFLHLLRAGKGVGARKFEMMSEVRART